MIPPASTTSGRSGAQKALSMGHCIFDLYELRHVDFKISEERGTPHRIHLLSPLIPPTDHIRFQTFNRRHGIDRLHHPR